VPDPRGFLKAPRRHAPLRPVSERVSDHLDVHLSASDAHVAEQAGRCMNCGVPFCHTGCPLGNLIPDWNEHARKGRWREAIDALHATNNFPEFTGRLCPAPCEEACVLTLADEPVTIEEIEYAIAERAWSNGFVTPAAVPAATGRSVAVIGSGPAGLAAAQQLARAGHRVVVFERDDVPGGLLTYGIPDYKLEKRLVERRVEQLEAEGVVFRCGCEAGIDVGVDELRARFDAIVLATGAQQQRELDLPGRALDGVHLALPYLRDRNRAVGGRPAWDAPISAAGKRVVVLGGGDTSADCLGCALREGATSVIEIAHGPQPPSRRDPLRTWPEWPKLLRSYPAHGEGGDRRFAFVTTGLEGSNGTLQRLVGKRVEFAPTAPDEPRRPVDVEGGREALDVDLVLIAIGFTGPERADGLLDGLGVRLAHRGTVLAQPDGTTSVEGVYAAGDCVLGADLIVTAIAAGRRAAAAVDRLLARAPAQSA
jgi:glutamate synthase (NADPH/NADH) small chain